MFLFRDTLDDFGVNPSFFAELQHLDVLYVLVDERAGRCFRTDDVVQLLEYVTLVSSAERSEVGTDITRENYVRLLATA